MSMRDRYREVSQQFIWVRSRNEDSVSIQKMGNGDLLFDADVFIIWSTGKTKKLPEV